jgi:hypothetical protein
MAWAKEAEYFRKSSFESPVLGRHNGTINDESGYGDISNILKNNLNPRLSPIQIPVHW